MFLMQSGKGMPVQENITSFATDGYFFYLVNGGKNVSVLDKAGHPYAEKQCELPIEKICYNSERKCFYGWHSAKAENIFCVNKDFSLLSQFVVASLPRQPLADMCYNIFNNLLYLCYPKQVVSITPKGILQGVYNFQEDNMALCCKYSSLYAFGKKGKQNTFTKMTAMAKNIEAIDTDIPTLLGLEIQKTAGGDNKLWGLSAQGEILSLSILQIQTQDISEATQTDEKIVPAVEKAVLQPEPPQEPETMPVWEKEAFQEPEESPYIEETQTVVTEAGGWKKTALEEAEPWKTEVSEQPGMVENNMGFDIESLKNQSQEKFAVYKSEQIQQYQEQLDAMKEQL